MAHLLGIAMLLTQLVGNQLPIDDGLAAPHEFNYIVLRGQLTYYAYPMREVYVKRLTWGHLTPCADCVGMLAMDDFKWIGRRVTLILSDGRVIEPLLVVDCGEFITPGRIAEIDLQWARRLHMNAPLDNVTLHVSKTRGP